MSIHKKEGERKKGEVIFSLSLVALLVSLCVSSFALGRLTAAENQKGLVIENATPVETDAAKAQEGREEPPTTSVNTSNGEDPLLVGSKNSDKYHYPWCSGAKRINDENLVSFASYEEAREAGYVPAGNCAGLK